MQTKRMTYPGRFLPYALLAPQVIVTLIFFIWPAGQALYQSLLREDAFGLRSTFVGLENFARLFRDGAYLNSLSATAVFAIGTTHTPVNDGGSIIGQHRQPDDSLT